MNRSPLKLDYDRGLYIVIGFFCLVMGSMIVGSDFLPIGFDNNETFSSIIHARNMVNFPFGLTFGITNESYGLTAASHPYVYTHQGNFPRLFAFVLYVAGAESAQAQILFTTFTIGLASIWFAYAFLARKSSPLVATIFCVILLSDYVMSTQWWINTWRVWHFFFFFGFACLALRLAEARRPLWPGLFVFLMAASALYTEIVFAAFVLAFFVLFFAWESRKRFWRWVIGSAAASLGAAAAVAILVAQLVLYLGWDGFLTDMRLTFLARNSAPQDELAAFTESVWRFMREHNIVYWDNNVLANTALRSPRSIVTHYFRFNFLPYSPYLTYVAGIALLALLLTRVTALTAWCEARVPATRALLGIRLRSEHSLLLLLPCFVLAVTMLVGETTAFGHFLRGNWFSRTSSLLPVFAALICAWALVLAALCRSLPADRRRAVFVLAGLSFLIAFLSIHAAGLFAPLLLVPALGRLLLIIALAWLFFRAVRRLDDERGGVSIATVFALAFFGVVAAAFAYVNPVLYESSNFISGATFIPFWVKLTSSLGGLALWQVVLGLTFLCACMVVLRFNERDRAGETTVDGFLRLMPALFAGIVAFLIAYMIFPGYVFSAYNNRYCPYTVFLNIFPLTALVVLLCANAGNRGAVSVPASGAHPPASSPRPAPAIWLRNTTGVVLLGAFVTYWSVLQFNYVKEFSPARLSSFFAEIRKLEGRSTVVSTYAAPAAAMTNQWSYFDPAAFTARESFDGNRFILSPRDERYLWLADRDVNDEYRRPEYFICWMHTNYHDLVLKGSTNRCGGMAGIQAIRKQEQFYFLHREVARDERRDLWSIVRLDHEAPPSLARLRDDVELRVELTAERDWQAWNLRVDFRYVHQDGLSMSGVKYVLEVTECSGPRPAPIVLDEGNSSVLWLPQSFFGLARVAVVVETERKAGPRFFSAPLPIGLSDADAAECIDRGVKAGTLGGQYKELFDAVRRR